MNNQQDDYDYDMSFNYQGKKYEYGDIVSITWEGLRTPKGYAKSETIHITLYNGEQMTIKGSEMTESEKSMFVEVAFPG